MAYTSCDSDGLLGLPEELTIHIFGMLQARSLLALRMVCRHFMDMIDNCAELQYIVTLDAAGMSDVAGNSNIMGYADRLQVLRDKIHAWRTLTWSSTEVLSVPLECSTYELVAGVYMKSTNGRNLVRVQLPSEDTTSTVVVHEDVGVQARDFAIDPSQDLLVLVEEGSEPPPNTAIREARVYLRRMTAPTESLDVPKPVLSFQIYPHADGGNRMRSAWIHIFYDMLALFIWVGTGRRLLIWNWQKGTQLVDLHEPDIPPSTYDFAFLSREAFFLTNVAHGGAIQIFTYSVEAPAPPVRVATLRLPTIRENTNLWSLVTHTQAVEGGKHRAGRLFAPAQDLRLHVMSLTYRATDIIYDYELFICNHDLLKWAAADPCTGGTCKEIPWTEWGPDRTRFLPAQIPMRWLRYVYGCKVVFPAFTTGHVQSVNVLDFHVNAKDDCEVPQTDELYIEKYVQSSCVAANRVLAAPVTTSLPYRLTARTIEGRFLSLKIDNERILGFKDSDSGNEIIVYSF
ncbi:hypothetical protein FISHEDRAFT_77261 [Fistulina hepatica ATCC 64428]|uniref:F-box domain-containing protein n=1 Tax=Fistulina hepatica ATCC 64428 TaxID=1128425 RepID=A0A0D7A0Q6_9AGAR|nr:hypothetical protein FISHEDRAFT_77261 [Fistulina hepatica ATCC 64428]